MEKQRQNIDIQVLSVTYRGAVGINKIPEDVLPEPWEGVKNIGVLYVDNKASRSTTLPQAPEGELITIARTRFGIDAF